jgi:predicted metal-dependent peptidase
MNPTKLEKARASIILTSPFYASLLYGLPMVQDSNLETMATNGEEIRFNPQFVESIPQEELVFILCHEIMHCVFLHSFRADGKDPEQWNVATDLVINELLKEEKIGSMPVHALYDPQLTAQGNKSAEKIYEILMQKKRDEKNQGQGQGQGNSNQKTQKSSPKGQKPLDQVQKNTKDPGQQTSIQEGIKVMTTQAANIAKIQGKLSAGISRIVQEITKPKKDWKELLRHYMNQKTQDYYTFAKPKRRFLSEDLNLPSLAGEKLGSIAIAIDCSGSINQALLNEFAAEIQSIREDSQPSSIHLIYFDSKVLKTETIEQDQDFKIQPVGGGGTAFSPIFQDIAEKDINPIICIVLTDLQCSDFGQCPEYPVLWATNDKEKAPFGEIISIK